MELHAQSLRRAIGDAVCRHGYGQAQSKPAQRAHEDSTDHRPSHRGSCRTVQQHQQSPALSMRDRSLRHDRPTRWRRQRLAVALTTNAIDLMADQTEQAGRSTAVDRSAEALLADASRVRTSCLSDGGVARWWRARDDRRKRWDGKRRDAVYDGLSVTRQTIGINRWAWDPDRLGNFNRCPASFCAHVPSYLMWVPEKN